MLTDQSNAAAELIVLSLLSEEPAYGYAISKQVSARSAGQVRLTPGVLYPLLKSLESQGLVLTSWEEVRAEDSDEGEGRKRKWYRLSAKGKKRLEQRIASHRAFRAVIDAFIGPEDAQRREVAR